MGTYFAVEMSEELLVHTLLDAFSRHGWLVCHFRPARTAKGWRTAVQGHVGMPDIIAVHPSRGVAFIEAKSSSGRLSHEQRIWGSVLDRLAAIGLVTYLVVRPADWLSGSLDELIGIDGT